MADSEATLLRREVASMHWEMEALKGAVAERDAALAERDGEIARLKARLAAYENPNAPSSSRSLFNSRRNDFRSKRGSRGSDGEGSDRPALPDGEGGTRRRRGPPEGHAGVSHRNTPAFCTRYGLPCCPSCGAGLEDAGCVHKLVSDFDACKRMVSFTAVLETGWCPRCSARVTAPSPFLEGTSLGPVALGLVTELFWMRCTDADISRLFEAFFRFRISASAVASARRAVSGALDRQLDLIKLAFLACAFVQGDETGIKIGIRGKGGYVWVFICRNAVFVVASPSRGIPVLLAHFGWILHLPVVSDGHAPYKQFAAVQRCWRHLLAHVEAAAVDGKPEDVARYERMIEFYRRIKGMGTLAPLTMTLLTREIRGMIAGYPEGKLKTHLENAVPYMFTFLAHPGMPPHNNASELAIRDAVVRQRNVRHQITTPEGRDVFSRLLTFAATCQMNGIFPCRAVVEMLRDPQWDMFNPGGQNPLAA